MDALRVQGGEAVGEIVALDIPGCGAKRDRNISKLGPDDVAVELVSELQDAGVKDVVLVGHSQAGTILPLMVAQQPSLFRRLIYVAACAPLPGQDMFALLGSGVRGSSSEEIGWPLDPQRNAFEAQMPLMFCNDMAEAEAASFIARLGKDRWPDDVTQGTIWDYEHLEEVQSSYVICLRDGTLPVPWQETFAARLKAKRIVRVDAGHQVMNTRPHALAEILRSEAAPPATGSGAP
jgi:pimeloyl-ACP methyl ester carboxylesterase